MKLRIVFCGTPEFAVPSLKQFLQERDFEIVGVVTQPDRARGRGQKIAVSPVKQAATAAGLAVHQPEKIRSAEAEALLGKLAPDAIAIIAYGQIVPARLLGIARFGWINLHASLLPKYRGAAPIAWAIANGEKRTGVTTMRIDAGMDTGDILLQKDTEIGAEEAAPELSLRLASLGAPLMVETLRGLADGRIAPRAQNHAEATMAPMLKKEDGRIAWSRTAEEISNRMRGFAPWPGAYTDFRGQVCHLWGKPAARREDQARVGTLRLSGDELLVKCGGGTLLKVERVKLEGRKEVAAAEFARGARLGGDERFGSE